jgi:hypothetical protein
MIIRLNEPPPFKIKASLIPVARLVYSRKLHFYFNPRPAMSQISDGEDAKPPTPLAPTDLKDMVNKTSRKPGAEHFTPGLKRVPMYWHPYQTMAKQRWWGREILELVSTEFRDRSIEYYVRTVSIWQPVEMVLMYLMVEIRVRVWRSYCQWGYRQTWDDH